MHRWQGLTTENTDELPPLVQDAPPPSALRSALELPALLLVSVLIVFLVKTFVAQAFYIPSESMVPQLEVGDRVVVSRTAYRLHEPRRGDIVVFPNPEHQPGTDPILPLRIVRDGLRATTVFFQTDEELIKRIVGLPGEVIEARNGHVLIDGRQLAEPYLPPDVVQLDFGPEQIPEGHVFVMGDNRTNSGDSRVFHAIPIDTIVGRAIAVVWPPTRTEFL